MKHTWIILSIGMLAAVIAHVTWFQLRRPSYAETPAGLLAWLQADLSLSAEQFARIKLVHERSGPQLRELAVQAARMRTELEDFEKRRRNDDHIDFLAFSRFVEQRREFDRRCLTSTRRLLAAAAREMTPDQRERYLQRFEPMLGPGARGLN